MRVLSQARRSFVIGGECMGVYALGVRLRPRVERLIRAGLVILAGGLMQACTFTDPDAGVLNRLAGAALSTVPYVPSYKLDRELRYPLSSQADIYVAGDNQQLVDELGHQLKAYFNSVAVVSGDQEPGEQGFYLTLRSQPLSAASGLVISSEVVGENAISKLDGETVNPTHARRLEINITDLHSNRSFDQITISFLSSQALSSTRGQNKFTRAFEHTAALLAGHAG